jgi:colanic acid biosynthesis glycosyl transferase WcaI
MKIVVHDYSGHPFQVQLSRVLARSGYQVVHLHNASFQTPKGLLVRQATDPVGLDVQDVYLSRTFEKHTFVKRFWQEREYGRLISIRIRSLKPDVVLSANMPLDPQAMLQATCRRLGAKFIFWLQDLYSVAIARHMSRKIPIVGSLIGQRYSKLEGALLRQSDHVVAISDGFATALNRWKVPSDRVSVIRNWAPADELAPRPRRNSWSAEQGLDGKQVLLYSGTLGLKHNPCYLAQLAVRLKDHDRARVVVVSEGPGAEWLKEQALSIPNLMVLPFQPYERFPEVLATADVLVALLEDSAGQYSVPSKVLSYFCAARPLLAALPKQNLAARLIQEADAGLVCAPDGIDELARSARLLLESDELRSTFAKNALAYAQREFDVDLIRSRFEQVIERCFRRPFDNTAKGLTDRMSIGHGNSEGSKTVAAAAGETFSK